MEEDRRHKHATLLIQEEFINPLQEELSQAERAARVAKVRDELNMGRKQKDKPGKNRKQELTEVNTKPVEGNQINQKGSKAAKPSKSSLQGAKNPLDSMKSELKVAQDAIKSLTKQLSVKEKRIYAISTCISASLILIGWFIICKCYV